MQTELIFLERQFQLVIQEADTKKALAFLNIFLNGQSGTIYSLHGRGLMYLCQYGEEIFNRFNLKEMLFVCEDAVLKKIIEYAPKIFEITCKEKIELSDKPMTSVVVRRKEE